MPLWNLQNEEIWGHYWIKIFKVFCLNTTHALKSCRWSFMPLTVEKMSNKFKIGSRLQCSCTRPIYTPTHITDVPTSCFLCCSYFLFELMYILPVWVVSAFSCLRWCNIFLFLCVVATSCISSWAVFSTSHIFVVAKSCLPWCSYFLFDRLYLLPIS